ncbi:MAG: hypothetical protein ACLPX8_13230, partial [Bryobacteraceae bacterium]
MIGQSKETHWSGLAVLHVHIGAGASQSIPVSPPIGAPGGAAAAGIGTIASAGRSRKRLMSA